MPDQSSKKPKRPCDLSLLAKKIVDLATEGEPAEEPSEKNPHALALGRLGGKKGGKARAPSGRFFILGLFKLIHYLRF